MRRHVRFQLRIDVPAPRVSRAADDEGVALVMVLLVGALLFTVGLSIVLVADIDTLISGSYRDGLVARYAAEAVGDATVEELASLDEWTPILSGAVTSEFWGTSAASGSEAADEAAVTAALQQQAYGAAPWAGNTPRWRLFGRGAPDHDLPFTGLSPGSFALVWVSDDVTETDGDRFADGNDTVALYVRVWGPGRARADVQRVITRIAPGIVRLVAAR